MRATWLREAKSPVGTHLAAAQSEARVGNQKEGGTLGAVPAGNRAMCEEVWNLGTAGCGHLLTAR